MSRKQWQMKNLAFDNETVLLRGTAVLLRVEIPRNNARHACKYRRALQMGHSNVSWYCFW